MYSPEFKPRKIDTVWTMMFNRQIVKELPMQTRQPLEDLRDLGWRFVVCNTENGQSWCIYQPKLITLSIHWFRERQEKKGQNVWVVAHEISHAWNHINGTNDSHGPNFMELLKLHCPIEFIGFELDYKPGNAAKAGIVRHVNIEEI